MEGDSVKEVAVWSVFLVLALMALVLGNLYVILDWPYGMLILASGVGGAALSSAALLPKLWLLRSQSFFFPLVIPLLVIGTSILLLVLPRYHDYFFVAFSSLLLGGFIIFSRLLRFKWSLLQLALSYTLLLWGFLSYWENWSDDMNIFFMGSIAVLFILALLLIQVLWLLKGEGLKSKVPKEERS